MATSTGKKARRQHGTKVSAKRAKARKTTQRTFGKLAYSVVAKNAEQAIDANERITYQMAEARRLKGFDYDQNVAVTPSMPTRAQVEAARQKAKDAARKSRKNEEDYE